MPFLLSMVDAYVYGVMCDGAGNKPDAMELTKTNIYDEMLKGSEALDNALVSETGNTLVIVEVDGSGLAVKAGSVTVTAKA